MDKFSSLLGFTKVVEEGSFAAAARALGLSRSQVNKSVINLEEHLGVQLLNRTTRAVAATPSGQAFYERARAILSDLAEAECAVSEDLDEPRGQLEDQRAHVIRHPPPRPGTERFHAALSEDQR